MGDEELRHRLAAILVADVAGYSRLMADDERGTLAALDLARGVFKLLIESNRGRVIDMAGDSVLAVFDSANGAVAAALTIQDALTGQGNKLPEHRRMQFRIGIHLGDVIEKPDGTVYGDGVNIAARLQSLADPGGLTVSDSVKTAVRGKVSAAFEDQGEQTVKNISEPVRTSKVVPAGKAGPRPPGAGGEVGLPMPDKPSIAVLPFTNMSGDAEQEYFADGITEDIITDISQVSGLFVVARNSSFVFKGRAVDVKDVGRRLGVRHVLEGSVRKAGGKVRITAQLIDAHSGGHLWAERFDRDLEDIFAVQDEVTRKIVDVLKVRLTAPEQSRREHRGKVNPEAYDLAVRARSCLFRFTPQSVNESRVLLERALQLDDRFALAYANLATVHFQEYLNGWSRPGEEQEHLARATELVHKALAIDPDEAIAHLTLALVSLWRRQYDDAERAIARAIALTPNFAEAFLVLGQLLDFTGRGAESIDAFEQAIRLDPEFGLPLHALGRAQIGLGRYAEAEQNLKRRLVLNPNSDMTRVYLAALYGIVGRPDEARPLWSELQVINPHFTVERLRRVLPYRDAAWVERIIDGLRKAGLV